jgi:DNA mismatch repair protein MSH4
MDASQAVKYIDLSLSLTFAFHSLRIKYQPSEGTMMIDISTIQSLELIQNVRNAKSKDCLFGVLNKTLTPMGSRMLRSFILQPSTQAYVLGERYDALEELSVKEDVFLQTRQGTCGSNPFAARADMSVIALKSFQDIEKLLTSVCGPIDLSGSVLPIAIAHHYSNEA